MELDYKKMSNAKFVQAEVLWHFMRKNYYHLLNTYYVLGNIVVVYCHFTDVLQFSWEI